MIWNNFKNIDQLTFQSLPVTLRTTMFKIQKILYADYIEFMFCMALRTNRKLFDL